MEGETKNKETEENDLANKENISDKDNQNIPDNNSEAFRHMNLQKIKINEEKLKDTKDHPMEIKLDLTNTQNQITTDINNKNNPLMHSTFNFIDSKNYYLKINRCLTARIKKIILSILIVISICFIFISLFDIIHSIKKTSFFKNKKFLMNNIFIFTIHIIYILSLLLFQGISVLLEPKENFIFNIISILFLIFIVILRTVLVVKNDDKNITMLLNFFSCFCLTFINFIIFVITLKYLKMKKNVQQNIEEIINFTDILRATNSKIGEKKDNQLMLNNSGDIKPEMNNIDNKKGITNLVEESNNNAIGEQQNIKKK
jgi:hypothetical protein